MSTRKPYDPNERVVARARFGSATSAASDDFDPDPIPTWDVFDALILTKKKRADVLAAELGLDRTEAVTRAKELRATKGRDLAEVRRDERLRKDEARRREYIKLRELGTPVATACSETGYPRSSAHDYERRKRLQQDATKPKPKHRLRPEAIRALDDFEYFRRRYLGRVSVPWQVEAANEVRDAIARVGKDFIVVNVPPGSGKTTLFTLDIPLWLIVRNRRIRILEGSHTADMAEQYSDSARRELERTIPYQAAEELAAKGLEVDAEATLAGDFGAFRPADDDKRTWRAPRFFVSDETGGSNKKEPTVNSFGKDGGVIGNRVDFQVWDDLVTDKNMQKVEQRDDIWRWWLNTIEPRLEPDGVLLLQGQRIAADDHYRRCLDRVVPVDPEVDDEDTEFVPKYRHIVYRAHYEDRCVGDHGRTAKPYPNGCLLDPLRLPWKGRDGLAALQHEDPGTYQTVYQQEDGDPTTVLVQRAWINGGRDSDGFDAPGCWDPERVAGTVPDFLRTAANYRVVTVDPSPTRFWAIQDWVYVPQFDLQYLIDLHSARMEAPDLWHWDALTGQAYGLLVDWVVKAKGERLPIRYLVFERNAAQRFFLQDPNFKRWMGQQSIIVRPHDTGLNKSDPKLGVPGLKEHYRHGRVRIPGDRATGSRAKMMRLVDEVTRWPEGRTDDQVMGHWFLVHNLPRLSAGTGQVITMKRPSWMARTA